MTKQGKTTGNLKMRSGPGMQFEPPIAFLEPDTALEILGEDGDWWKVRAAGKEGYVGKKYVAVSESLGADVAALAKDSARQTGRETGISSGSISKQGGREAGDRDHKGVDEK
jgi:uncharacterized protein YraI